jgi:hypothetical protein
VYWQELPEATAHLGVCNKELQATTRTGVRANLDEIPQADEAHSAVSHSKIRLWILIVGYVATILALLLRITYGP